VKVVSENLLEILPAINRVSRQVIKSGPGSVSQVNGEGLDDEEVIICHVCPACKVIVLQPNARVGFAIVFDNVIRHPKMFRALRG
jgi:hypothetical protein